MWCQVRTAFLLTDKYPTLTRGVTDEWIWEAMNTETLPHGWEFTETDCSGARCVLVFEIDHGPRLGELAAVEALLQMMEERYAKGR